MQVYFGKACAFLSSERKRRKRVLGNGSEAANMAANLLYREPILITREDTLLTDSSYVGHSLLAENL